MSGLIKIAPRQLGGEAIETVNARELHAFLEVGTAYAAWINERIEQYGFVESKDYVVFSPEGKNPRGGRPLKEHAISMDMAKELAMVERTDKGKQARQYFIACERAARAGEHYVEDRKRLRHEAAASYKVMSQVLAMRREREGKKCAPHHFMNEARLVNQALAGKFEKLDRDQLSVEQLDALAALEVRNAVLIASGCSFHDRKVQVQAAAIVMLTAAPAKAQLGGAK